jgi:hypothetical protein
MGPSQAVPVVYVTPYGEEVCRKIEKPVPRTFELRIVLGKLYPVGSSGIHERFFGQKSDLNMQFGCGAEKLMHYSVLHQVPALPLSL